MEPWDLLSHVHQMLHQRQHDCVCKVACPWRKGKRDRLHRDRKSKKTCLLRAPKYRLLNFIKDADVTESVYLSVCHGGKNILYILHQFKIDILKLSGRIVFTVRVRGLTVGLSFRQATNFVLSRARFSVW